MGPQKLVEGDRYARLAATPGLGGGVAHAPIVAGPYATVKRACLCPPATAPARSDREVNSLFRATVTEAIVVRCLKCGSEVPAAGRFCSACGSRLASDELPTFSSPARPPRPPASSGPSPAGSGSQPGGAASHQGRFLPGIVLAGRFRIVALLGRGGMGEVYRADDLTLDQPVALKFLPEAARDAEHLERFRQEVKIARKVSHPNVCRVYDISEAEGRHFLSMEYVDGEDLATLLRRIGRLPPDKALEVARKVCAGLAAAHDKGVLHRDLKPANVMLDGRGNVMITDFGLAALAEQVSEADVRSGTPAYMAPEQLEGREVTTRSDIYSLGLVLYEVFTGRKAFEGTTLAEATRRRTDATPQSPSLLVRDLDPAAERAIMRCLERDPAQRPASVLAVAASLPGGDPLAAALAAGETPSPQVVADAGETTGLTPRAAVVSLAVVVAGLLLALTLGTRMSKIDEVGLAPPEVLSAKAREILGRLGYTAAPADSAEGFAYATDLDRYFSSQPDRPDWDRILAGRPSLLSFWYRTSPRRMVVTDFHDDLLTPGVVTPTDPPPTDSGMVDLGLDAQGRMIRLQVIPPEKEDAPREAGPPDWRPLFAAAELDPAQLRAVDPAWLSLAASDVREAWEGTWPRSDQRLRVEAAALHGRPVFFRLIGPWTKPERMPSREDEASKQSRSTLITIVGGTAILGGILLAFRNYVLGRGDRRGAFRLAAFIFASHMLLWVCRTHLVIGTEGFGLFLIAMGNSLFAAAVVWAVYLSIEPYIRRHWPQAIISWSRLLAGRLRDPLLGRDLLIGVLLGIAWLVIVDVSYLVIERLGGVPTLGRTEYLLGGRHTLGAWLGQAVTSVRGTLLFFFVLFLFRVLLRRPWLATTAFVALFATSRVLSEVNAPVQIPTSIAIYGIAALAVVRFGLVALAAGLFTVDLIASAPTTASLSSWYAPATAFVFLSVLALAVWGFYTSLGGRPLWSGTLFD
jgi:predicted Ser/Thr protein kinase